jgi:hypothetical protein
LNIVTFPTSRRARSLVGHRDMDGLDCYGSSEHEEVEAQTLVKDLVQPVIEMAEMTSLPAAVARVILCLSVRIRS